MISRAVTRCLILVILLTPAIPALAQDDDYVERVYPVFYLDLRYAKLLIEEKFPEIFELDPHRVYIKEEGVPQSGGGERNPQGYLRIFVDPASHEKVAMILDIYDAPPRDQLFQIHLIGTTQEPAKIALPSKAKAALDDLREFFPENWAGYRLIDSTLIKTSHRGMAELEDYIVQLRFRGHRDPDNPMHVEGFSLLSKWDREGKQNNNELIGTSFYITPGETVVVGTSKLNGGDEALIVLVTAIEAKK
ncbi:MAG: hypothetical protein R3344_02440 [Acidobacteriota bacterium]|nr:hypothetical protein [Acidobacteriota bacterium]